MFKKSLSLVLSLVLLFSIFTSVASATETQQTTSNFEGLVDVGKFSMYIKVQGERKKGVPTVVFENGNGDSSAIWDLVAPQVAQQTRVVTYDRIGIGQSDSPDRNTVDYTAEGEAKRLKKLLKKANIKGPIILVGHSISGVYMREFQSLYPNRVKGIVFVDASTEHQEQYLFPEFDAATQQAIMNDDLTGGTGIPVELSIDDWLVTSTQIDAIQANDPLRNLPITVLSGANHGYPPALPNLEQRWAERQAYLASLSDDVVHTIDPNNGHYLHQQNPTLVINAISEILNRISN